MADDDATKADDAATTDEQSATDAPKDAKEPKEPKERRSFAVPAWAAGILAALLLLGAGFAIGWVSNDGGGGHDRNEMIGRRFPGPERGPQNQENQRGPQIRPLPPRNQENQQNQQDQQDQQPANGAFLGVQVEDASGNQNGASVAAVEPGSPADDAGIRAGDVITAIDGDSVNSAAQLAQRITSHSAGDKVTITLTRSGSSRDVDVTLGAASNSNLPGLPNGGSNGPSLPGLPGLPNNGGPTQSN